MNILEWIGLLAIIMAVVYFSAPYIQAENEAKAYKLKQDLTAWTIECQLALRWLFNQHQEQNIREALKRVAETYYAGAESVALGLNDDEYLNRLRADLKMNHVSFNAYDQAKTAIRERGYPLAIENGKVINLSNKAVLGEIQE